MSSVEWRGHPDCDSGWQARRGCVKSQPINCLKVFSSMAALIVMPIFGFIKGSRGIFCSNLLPEIVFTQPRDAYPTSIYK